MLAGFTWERKLYQRLFSFIGTRPYFKSEFQDLVNNKSIFLSRIFSLVSYRACLPSWPSLIYPHGCWSHFVVSVSLRKRCLCPLCIPSHAAAHRSKDELKVQVEPFIILFFSCDLCLWKQSHWLPESHCESWSNLSGLLGSGLQSCRTHPGQPQNLQLRKEPRTDVCPVPCQKRWKFFFLRNQWSCTGLELHLSSSEFPITMKAWKVHVGLSCSI